VAISTDAATSNPPAVARRSRVGPAGYAIAAALLLAFVGLLSLGVGASGLSWDRVVASLISPDGSADRGLIVDVRLPRILVSALVGANLAVAGLLAQTLTRNPLASPQTFGINAGAAVAVVTATIAFPSLAGFGTVAAFVGAGLVGLCMWALSASGSVTTIGLALAGMTIQIMLSAVVQAILITNNATQDIVFWLAGSVTGAQWPDVRLVLPFTVIGLLGALVGARQFGVLALDATTGRALGQHTRRVSGTAAILVMLLAGSSVAVAGPIGFVGLIVPHLVRKLVGAGFGRSLVLCILLGPLLLTSSDLVGRLVSFPKETPAGIITALIGAPAFLYLAMKQRTR
jgi:ABC-type Fe3+-siderophore transport system permease subunit